MHTRTIFTVIPAVSYCKVHPSTSVGAAVGYRFSVGTVVVNMQVLRMSSVIPIFMFSFWKSCMVLRVFCGSIFLFTACIVWGRVYTLRTKPISTGAIQNLRLQNGRPQTSHMHLTLRYKTIKTLRPDASPCNAFCNKSKCVSLLTTGAK